MEAEVLLHVLLAQPGLEGLPGHDLTRVLPHQVPDLEAGGDQQDPVQVTERRRSCRPEGSVGALLS